MCSFYKLCAVLFLCVHCGVPAAARDELAAAVYQDLMAREVPPGDAACRETTLAMLEGVQNFTLWAVWMWESSALSPVGSLSGAQQQLGGWAQCALAPRAAYCLVRVRAGGRAAPGGEVGLDASAEEYLRTPTKYGRHLNKQDYGVCLPASCSRAFARLFLGALLAHGPYGAVEHQLEVESCERAGGGTEFTADFYLFVIAAAALIIFVGLCTVYTQYIASDPKSRFLQLSRCFSVPDNYRLLFEAHPDEIPELNGIRFVTSAGVVMLHSLMLRRAISNGVEVEQMIDHPLLWWLLQTDLLVETFFTMSGFLLVRSALARPDRGGLWRQVVRRYCRLAPAMLAVVWALSSAFLHAGSGPLWAREAGLMVAPCRRTWWLAALMLGNYVRAEEMCYLPSWSVQCEFHFFLLGCCIVWVYRRSRAGGLAAFAAAAAAALATPAIVTDVNGFPPVLLPFGFERVKDLFHDEYFLQRYIPTHYRLSPYLVGMAGGLLLGRGEGRKIKQRYALLACLSSGLLVLALLYGGACLYSVHVPRAAAALYAALNRPMWALAVCALIGSCVRGTVPLVSQCLGWRGFRPLSRLAYGLYLTHCGVFFHVYITTTILINSIVPCFALVSDCLGWRGFRPLSRLAYGLYLTHCGVFFHVYMTATGPSRVGVVETVVTYLGALCLSLALAGALWLLVEAPANNLCAIALSTRRADNNERGKPEAVSDDQGQEPNTGTVIYSDK